jgi:mitochondrial splicing suppressor protein 51
MFREAYSDFAAQSEGAGELHEKVLVDMARIHEDIVEAMVEAGDISPVGPSSMASTRRFIVYSRVCALCKKNEYELPFQPNMGVCCQTCKYGWCCSQEHYDEYMKTGLRSSELCSQFVQSAVLETFHLNHAKDFKDVFAFAPSHHEPPKYDPPFTARPADWTEYFQSRFPREYAKTQLGILAHQYLPAASYLLSQSCTCLNATYRHGLDEYTKGPFASKSMTIHIVGAAQNYEVPARGKVSEELMHSLPAISSLKTVFVGPEVGVVWKDDSKRLLCPNMGCCPVCTAQNRTRSIEIFGYTYHEYKQDPMFSQPDLIVAFNAGLSGNCTDSWKTSLSCWI